MKGNERKKSKKKKKSGVKQWLLLGMGILLITLTVFFICIIIFNMPAKETVPAASLSIKEEQIEVKKDVPASVSENAAEDASKNEQEPEEVWEPYLSWDYLSGDIDSWNLIKNVEVTDGVTDYIEVNPKYYYAAYSPLEITVDFFDKEKELIATSTDDVSGGLFYELPKEARYAKVTYAKGNTFFVSSGICVGENTVSESGKGFYVVSKNSPISLTINQAVKMLKSWGTVLVLPGSYNESVQTYERVVNLYGVDKSLCEIVSYDGDYDYPPLEIGAGSVRNFAIKATGSDTGHSRLAYGIHADYNSLTDRSLTIYNCVIHSDYNAAIGMGLRRGSVTIDSCTLTGNGAEGSDMFMHDTIDPNLAGDQNLIIKNSTIDSIYIHSEEVVEGRVNLTFKNNSINSIDGINVATGEKVEGCFHGLRNFYLTAESEIY